MASAETVESFVLACKGMTEDEAFDAFVQRPEVAAWLGSDRTRHERLRREFHRVWAASWGRGRGRGRARPRAPAMAETASGLDGDATQGSHVRSVAVPSLDTAEAVVPQPSPADAPSAASGATHAPPPARVRPARPESDQERPGRSVAERPARALCPSCGRAGVEGFLVEDEVFFACRRCDARFDDAASLVPIVSIDLATFYFGGRLRALAVLVGLFCSAGLLAAGLLRL